MWVCKQNLRSREAMHEKTEGKFGTSISMGTYTDSSLENKIPIRAYEVPVPYNISSNSTLIVC